MDSYACEATQLRAALHLHCTVLRYTLYCDYATLHYVQLSTRYIT